jgi:hypothetical protein
MNTARLGGEIHVETTTTINPVVVNRIPMESRRRSGHLVVVVCMTTPEPKFTKIVNPARADDGW